MTTQRFTVDDGLEDVLCWEINDNENEDMTCGECAKLLNELHEEIEVCKQAYREIKEDAIKKTEENKELKKENEQLRKELFEERKDYILETYADNPVRRDEKLKELKKELKE